MAAKTKTLSRVLRGLEKRTGVPRAVTAAAMARNPKIPEVAKLEQQRARTLALERKKRGQWHWLSFANETRFLGGAIVWAHGIATATLRARDLDISQGFRGTVDIFCEPIPQRIMKEHIPPDLRNRLLSANEVRYRLEGRPLWV